MGAILSRGGSFVGAFIIGIIPLMKLRLSGHANDGPLGLSLHVIKHNAAILWHECLPWALSYHVYTAHDPSATTYHGRRRSTSRRSSSWAPSPSARSSWRVSARSANER